jgi:signal transduction histidine kinase/PAS domain-containing protein
MRFPKTIEMKLKLTHAVILAAGVVVLVTAYAGMSRSRAGLQHLMEVHDPLNRAISEMEVNIIKTGADVLKYLARADPQLRAEVQKETGNFARLKTQYDQLVSSEDLAAQLKESGNGAAALYGEYKGAGDRLMDAQDAGRSILQRVRTHVSKTQVLVDRWTEAESSPASERAGVLRDLERECATALALVSIYKHDHAGEFARALSRVGQQLYDSHLRLKRLAQTPADRRRLGEISDPLGNGISAITELAALCEGMRSDTTRLFELRTELDKVLHGKIQRIVEQDLSKDNAAAKRIMGRTLLMLGLLIPALLVASWVLGRKLLRSITEPLKVLATGATAIGKGDTSRRIVLEDPEEFANLARQFNSMAADLESTMVSKAELEVKEETLLHTYKALQEEVDERTRTAAALRESQEKIQRAASEWQQMFDCIQSPFLVLDANGRCHRANRAALQLCGGEFTPSGPQCGQNGFCPLADSFDSIIGQLRQGMTPVSIQKKDDVGRSWQLDGVQIRDTEAGERFIILVRDLTPLVTMQETLNRTERMSAMGALVSAVAHEVRNPLFILTATLEVLDAVHVVGPEAQEYFETVRQQVGRLDALMRDLLEYGKPSPLELSPGSLGPVIDRAAAECAPLSERLQVHIHNRVDHQLPTIPMDPTRLVQVFRNIIENAMQHSPKQSTVDIGARLLAVNGCDWIECSVQDQGRGFRPEDLDKVFQPFFTRREGGTGLGLAISQRIVEAHAGRLTASNASQGGAVVRVCFQVAGSETKREVEDNCVKA